MFNRSFTRDPDDIAPQLAATLHAGQMDKGGQPYIKHLDEVAFLLVYHWRDVPQYAIAAAWLHDALEDTSATPQTLARAGISAAAIGVIQELTRPPGLEYMHWIRQLATSGSEWALKIKLADNEHNRSPARRLPDSNLLLSRYLPARDILEVGLIGRFGNNGRRITGQDIDFVNPHSSLDIGKPNA
jgi:hypothetical protein